MTSLLCLYVIPSFIHLLKILTYVVSNTSVHPTIVVRDDDADPSSNILLPTISITFPPPSLPAPKTLVAVPLTKQIFISRLHPDTSIDDVKARVQSKIPNALITVDNYSQQFVVKKFWPNDLLFKGFTPHKRSRPTVSVSLTS